MPLESVLDALSVDNVRRHVTHIAEKIPSRFAGSENGRRMAEYSAQALHAAEVSAAVHAFPALVSFPEQAELKVLEPEAEVLDASTFGHSTETTPEGLVGELIYVGSGAYSDYEGLDVAGKIILTELSYSPSRQEKQRIAGQMGVAGAVMMNWGHSDNEALPFGSVKPLWGNPTPETLGGQMPTIPCVGVGRTTGLRLKGLCERGPVRVRLSTQVENVWRPVQITVGEVSAPDGKDFVIVGGHQDSWVGQAATDNAAGSACMLELARIFQSHRSELRRGLLFGFWTAHETGTMAGSTWFVDQNWDRLRHHAAGYLQIDQPGCVGTTCWESLSNTEMRRFHQSIEARLLGGRPRRWHRALRAGDSSFFGLGVPMLYGAGAFTSEELAASAQASFGWWHHTVHNTLDKLDWDWMAEHLRVYASYLWELCTMPILPYDFVSVANEFHDRLEELMPTGERIGLASALAKAEDLVEAAQRLDRTVEIWQERYASGEINDEGPACALNEVLKQLSRILLPLQSTVAGTYEQDPYGLTAQATMIPILYDLKELETLGRDTERAWMLETKLKRARNRVSDGLEAARAAIEQTLKSLD